MTPEALIRRIRDGHRFLLTSHANPDGDAIGSELGLARILRSLGKSATIWNRDPVPALYARLPGAGTIRDGEEPPPGHPDRFDAAIVLECPTLERTGLASRLAELPLINLDHHLGNAHFGEVNWVDPEAPAVSVLVADLARGLDVELDADAADCLYLALVTDTGGFRFGNATPAAFEAAARLVAGGAGVERVSHWLYESRPEGALRLLGEMLATLERHEPEGAVATLRLDRAMFERAGAGPGDSEGLIDVPRSIAGVEAVALLRELGDAEWKVSLRSRGDVDVAAIAAAHEGGGHRNAAGCQFRGEVEEGRSQFASELRRALEVARGV